MMISNAKSSMFFLPGHLDPGKNADDRVSEYFPATRAWERGFFYTSNMCAPYYISRAAKERAVVVGCSGLNTHYLLNPEQVKSINEAGVSLVWMALPKIKSDLPLIDSYLPLARDFFTSPQSPARFLMRGDAPRYALTHSTGGQIFFHLTQEPATNKKLTHTFNGGAIHVTPYFDTAHASRDHAPEWVQNAYKYYMGLKPDLAPNDRLLAGAYIKWNDYMDPSKDKDHPGLDSTCGQILQLQRRGQDLTANFNVSAARAIPSVFVLGDKDNFACPKTALDIATRVGASVEWARGGFHDPLSTHPQLLDVFIAKIDECVARHERLKTERVFVPHGPLKTERPEPLPPILIDELRYRAGSALQRGAGFLNASAGLFQRLG